MNDINTLWDATLAQVKTDLPDNPETDSAIPDGEYDAEILDFRCFMSKKGEWWMKWVMAVRGGLLDGRLLVRFVGVNARTAQYLKADVHTCLGREVAFGGGLADMSRGLTGPAGREMQGVVVRAMKRSRRAENGETYLDVYINSLVSRPLGPPKAAQGSGASPTPEEAARAVSGAAELPSAPSADAGRFDVPFPGDDEAPAEEDENLPF